MENNFEAVREWELCNGKRKDKELKQLDKAIRESLIIQVTLKMVRRLVNRAVSALTQWE